MRESITTAIRRASAPLIVRGALVKLREDPMFSSSNETAIRNAIGESPNTNSGAILDQALRELTFVGVTPTADPTANERYHTGQLNVAILAAVLFPDFLKQNPGPLYADPRLTAKKHWRDVYRYDKNGRPTGWTRFENRKRSEFNADGDLIRSRNADGTPKEVVNVRYQFDPKTKRLGAVEVD